MYYYRGGNLGPVVPQGFDAFSRWFEWAMKRFTEKWQVWLIQGLITLPFMMIGGIVYIVYMFSFIVRSGVGGTGGPPASPDMGVFFVVYAASVLITVVSSWFFMAGMLNTAMKQAQGEEIAIGDVFSGGWAILPLIGASLVIGIVYMIGIVLCIIPGLVWIAFTWLTMPLIVTRRMGVFEAISTSIAITRQNFLLIGLYGLVISMLAGMLAFMAMPAMTLLQVSLIADIYGITNPERLSPTRMPGSIPPPPVSYGTPPPPPPGVSPQGPERQA